MKDQSHCCDIGTKRGTWGRRSINERSSPVTFSFIFHQNRSSWVGSIHILSTFGKSQAETWDNTDEEGKRNGLTEVKKEEPKSARTMRVTAWTTAGSSRVAQAHKWRKGFLLQNPHFSLARDLLSLTLGGKRHPLLLAGLWQCGFTLAVKSCFLRCLESLGRSLCPLTQRGYANEARWDGQSI